MTNKAKPAKVKRSTGGSGDAVAKPRNKSGKMENLKPWKPGESGNPAGLSKARRRIQDALAMAAREKLGPDEAITELWKVYTDDDVPWPVRYSALTEIMDRAYGKAPQVVEIEGDVDTGTHAALKKLAFVVGGILAENVDP